MPAPVFIFASKALANNIELQQFYMSKGTDAEALRIADHIPIVTMMVMVQTKEGISYGVKNIFLIFFSSKKIFDEKADLKKIRICVML